MKFPIVFSILLILLSSCKTGTRLYGECEDRFLSCMQIEIKSNKYFEYFTYIDVGGGKIYKGNWKKLNKDTIVLNTFQQPQISKTYYNGIINNNLQDSIKIHVRDYKNPIGGVSIKINNNEVKHTDKNGNCYFSKRDIESINYYYTRTNKGFLSISNSKYNDINIYLEDIKGFRPDYITDEKIIFTKNKIIIFYNDSLTHELKRVSLKNKKFK